MKKYFTICKVSFMGALVHRFHYFAMFLTNIAHILMTYFLWRAIFASNEGIDNIMSFEHTFLYLALSSCIFHIYQSFIEHDLSGAMINGNVAVDLIKPYDLQNYWIFRIIGFSLCKVFTIGIPSILVIAFMLKGKFIVGPYLFVGIISLGMSFLISVNIDYITGIIAFYTQSVWGVSLVKETLVVLLSGMSVPIAFFPDSIAEVIRLLPFSSIFNTPMTIIINPSMQLNELLLLLGIQFFWVIAIYLFTKLIYRHCFRHTIINGG